MNCPSETSLSLSEASDRIRVRSLARAKVIGRLSESGACSLPASSKFLPGKLSEGRSDVGAIFGGTAIRSPLEDVRFRFLVVPHVVLDWRYGLLFVVGRRVELYEFGIFSSA